MMSLYIRYTSLAAQLLSLVDAGKKISLNDTHYHIRDKSIFTWLQEKFPGRIDLSAHEPSDLTYMADQFNSWSMIIDEHRKMEISHNGLCLLIAYCIEGVEANPNTVQTQPSGE